MTDAPLPDPQRAPGEASTRKLRRALGGLLVSLLVLVVLALAFVGYVIANTCSIGSNHFEARFQCANNLAQLGALWLEDRDAATPPPRLGGPALLLQWRTTGRVRAGQERVFLCPLDAAGADPMSPSFEARYDSIDLASPPRDLCSYAVRDFGAFPLDPWRTAPQPIAACVHHETGANVLFDDGSVNFFDREQLGVGPDDDVVAGPASKSPMLRVLIGGARSK